MRRETFIAQRQRLSDSLYPLHELRTEAVQGRCFLCATPLRKNSWRWLRFDDGTPDVKVCRDKHACAWRTDRGIRDTVV